MTSSTGTFGPCVHVERLDGHGVRRKRRVLYAVTSGLVALFVVVGILDGARIVDVFGVDTATVRRAAGTYRLDVRYATVSRPGLATPFEITVRRRGGFDGPVRIAVSTAYLSMWDENGLDPDPAAATADERSVVWEFDPPPRGDTLVVSYDARIEPAAQEGETGFVAVLDRDGFELATVTFRTRVLP